MKKNSKSYGLTVFITLVVLILASSTSWALTEVLFDYANTPQSWILIASGTTAGTFSNVSNVRRVASPSAPPTSNGALAIDMNIGGANTYKYGEISYISYIIGNSLNWWGEYTTIKAEVMFTGSMPSTGQNFDFWMSSGGYTFTEDRNQPAPVLNQWQTITFHMATAADPTQVRAMGIRFETNTTFSGTMYVDYVRGERPNPPSPLVDEVIFDFASTADGFVYAFGNLDSSSVVRVASPSAPPTSNGSLQFISQLPGPGYSSGALDRPFFSGVDWSSSQVAYVDYYHYLPPSAPDTTISADMWTRSSTNFQYEDHRKGIPFTPGDWTLSRLVPSRDIIDPKFVRSLGSRIEANGSYNGPVNLDYVVVHKYSDTRIFPIRDSGNVFGVAIWNSYTEDTNPSGTRNLSATAQVLDNLGRTYIKDSGTGGWPTGTKFKYKVVSRNNGTGAEEPGWQNNGFDDSTWTSSTTVGFTLGYTQSTSTDLSDNGETALDSTSMTVYIRCIFDVPTTNFSNVSTLNVKLEGEDAVACWFNGQYVGYDGCPYGVNSAGVRIANEPNQFAYNTRAEVQVGTGDTVSATYPFPHRNWTLNVVPVSTATSVPKQVWELFQ